MTKTTRVFKRITMVFAIAIVAGSFFVNQSAQALDPTTAPTNEEKSTGSAKVPQLRPSFAAWSDRSGNVVIVGDTNSYQTIVVGQGNRTVTGSSVRAHVQFDSRGATELHSWEAPWQWSWFGNGMTGEFNLHSSWPLETGATSVESHHGSINVGSIPAGGQWMQMRIHAE